VFAARLFRTPAERFESITDFSHRPEFREWQGMRLAHIDVGQGPIVVLLHGEPTWSYLWRNVIPPLVTAGFRCIAPDLPGFGRSDKPLEPAWYSYDNHTAALVSLFEDLDLHDVTLVMHDWGGPIGLRVATTERPDRVSRLVVMDTGVFTGEQQMSDEWLRFRAFVAARPDVPIRPLIRGGCKTPPTVEVLAAYDAPFPNEASKTGARRFPELIPLDPKAPGASEGRVVLQRLVRAQRPALVLWADADVVLPLESVGRQFRRLFQTADDLTVIRDAGHFLQEDQGDQIGRVIADWLTRQRS
jgi:haloalkane dehalogenase